MPHRKLNYINPHISVDFILRTSLFTFSHWRWDWWTVLKCL